MGCGRSLLISAVIWSGGPFGTGDAGCSVRAVGEESRFEAVQLPPQALMCGPNVLYMFLSAHNRPPSADRFFREITPGYEGLALRELRDASTRYGLPAAVRRCTFEQLTGECPMPVVALMESSIEVAGSAVGHYVLVVNADTKAVSVVDGTSGEQKRCAREAFCRAWKGYVIVATESQLSWLRLVSIVAAGAFVGWVIRQSKRSGGGLNWVCRSNAIRPGSKGV